MRERLNLLVYDFRLFVMLPESAGQIRGDHAIFFRVIQHGRQFRQRQPESWLWNNDAPSSS